MTPRILYDIEPDLYGAACSAEYEVEWTKDVWTYLCRVTDAKDAITAEIERVQKLAPNHEIFMAMGDSSNFRYSVYRPYKSNRRKYRKPAGYTRLREWICSTWPYLQLANVEGDDVVGISYEKDDIIYSRDKDLRTIPGLHINSEGELEEIEPWAADLKFYEQILTGDATDGYPGIRGCGPKKAAQILGGAQSEYGLWERVRAAYIKAAGKDPETPSVLSQARCARILRTDEYDHEEQKPRLWEPPFPMQVFDPAWHD